MADAYVEALWDIALTDGEIKGLMSGVSPLYVRPERLVYYEPLNNAAYTKALLDANLAESRQEVD